MTSSLLYIPSSRLVWMDCPATTEQASALAGELRWHHEDHYVVWNVSGTSDQPYDTEIFGGRVVNLQFAGFLCPPLLTLVEACASIHAWLRADPKNVVAIHCRSGRGRSAVVLSCVLAFLSVHGGGSGPQSPIDWLSHLAQLRGEDEHKLTLPTHRRYLQYFAELLLGSAPADASAAGCELRGIVLHGFPVLNPVPCVLLSSGPKAVYVSTAAQTLDDEDGSLDLCSYSYKGTGSNGRPVLVHGDVVLTVREESRSGQLLCRAGFHADFAAAAGVLRLPCAALDGAASRLPASGFIDVMLAPRAAAPGAASGGAIAEAVDLLRRAVAIHGGSAAAAAAAPRGANAATVFALDDDDDAAEAVRAMEAAEGVDAGLPLSSVWPAAAPPAVAAKAARSAAPAPPRAAATAPRPAAVPLPAAPPVPPAPALLVPAPRATSAAVTEAMSPASLLTRYAAKPSGNDATASVAPPTASAPTPPGKPPASVVAPVVPVLAPVPSPAPVPAPAPAPAPLPEPAAPHGVGAADSSEMLAREIEQELDLDDGELDLDEVLTKPVTDADALDAEFESLLG